ncbi:MAG: HNH endonuclease [Candidatus Paceibacterota bacterium]
MTIGITLRREVRSRAGDRCEYCGLEQDEFPFAVFHVEHIIARQHGGTDEAENLCLACHWCNLHKGPNIATLVEGQMVSLFHPRRDRWSEHFVRQGDLIVGLTPVGAGTVLLLDMNDDDRRRIRVPRLPVSGR